MHTVVQLVSQYCTHKTQFRLRTLSQLTRDTVLRPKPFKRLDTSSVAKTKMILSLGNTLGKSEVHLRGILGEVYIRYRHQDYTYEYMCNVFHWFKNSTKAKLFFVVYKYREYDSKMISKVNGFLYNVQLGPRRAYEITTATSSEHAVSPRYLYRMYQSLIIA